MSQVPRKLEKHLREVATFFQSLPMRILKSTTSIGRIGWWIAALLCPFLYAITLELAYPSTFRDFDQLQNWSVLFLAETVILLLSFAAMRWCGYRMTLKESKIHVVAA